MLSSSVRPFMLSAFTTLALSASAETFENFNSSKGIPINRIKTNLQNSCWSFHHFDVNTNGWNPGIEGDGAMVATTDALQSGNSGIYTPVLTISGDMSVSFEYTFNQQFSGVSRRWVKLCLATANNEIVQVLENIEFDGVNADLKKRYSTTFKNISIGEYRLVLQYGGSGGSSILAIDKLTVSAPFRYPGGCNSSPVAVRDRITGMPDRKASGSLLSNDKDANRQQLTAYLIRGSVNGTVELKEDGNFIFIPKKGFEGNSTSFVYKVCDNANLCSENTTVYINFPELATGLADFKGYYRNNGNVELMWNTKKANASGRYEIQRSMDGKAWESAGVVQAVNAVKGNDYTYMDKVSKNIVHNNDLYYRLKQFNEDGSITMSRLLIVRVYNTKTLTMISVTPNPSKNDIAVNVQLQQYAYVSMRILNSTGVPVMHKSLEAEKGINNFIVEGSSKLQPGMYTLEVIVNSKERMLVKLIKE